MDSNADGPIGNSFQWSSSSDYEDGAGHIDYNKVKGVLDSNRYASLSLTDASFVSCGAGCREYSVATFNMPGSKLLKASMAWNACTNGSVAPFVNNDLDLVLVRPATCSGGGIQQSTSGPTSEVEMLHQDCPAVASSTTWTIKIRIKNGATLNSCYGDATERVGVAWAW